MDTVNIVGRLSLINQAVSPLTISIKVRNLHLSKFLTEYFQVNGEWARNTEKGHFTMRQVQFLLVNGRTT